MADNKTLNLMEITPGTRVTLADGALAEVVENPMDGSWLICKYISSPAAPQLVGDGEHPVFATDIAAIAP